MHRINMIYQRLAKVFLICSEIQWRFDLDLTCRKTRHEIAQRDSANCRSQASARSISGRKSSKAAACQDRFVCFDGSASVSDTMPIKGVKSESRSPIRAVRMDATFFCPFDIGELARQHVLRGVEYGRRAPTISNSFQRVGYSPSYRLVAAQSP